MAGHLPGPAASERPWPHRPCRRCYERGMEAPFAERQLVVYEDCPMCLGSGVEPPTLEAGGRPCPGEVGVIASWHGFPADVDPEGTPRGHNTAVGGLP